MIPNYPDLPGIEDAGITGLRIQNTQAKALPGLPIVDLGTGARQREAAELARDMGIAFDITKRQLARSRAIARKRDRRNERKAKNFGKR